ncbi:hypothetical protein A2159_00460 [Candidatus Woesebacteria bacterium RBG_13_34_9]|uniref:Methyltransferase n=1 Tax=Candidatus Woesebacteria bacterium RBG_13_34_9 TaxID=1802477 RepID=A0A1F7X620_9BACT|nr:MAG: hypothetical protein A2159_00460 [Candidatus Woesebacteria bacterium RBG_13_34_9]
MLPLRTLINPKIFAHIILQSKNEEFFSKGKKLKKDLKVKKDSLLELISNLESLIKKLKIKRKETEWGEYYQDNNYSTIAIRDKYKKVKKYLELTRTSKNVWDLGANDGYFSRIASSKNILTVSIDNDEEAVEKNYQIAKKENDAYLLPIFLDLNNPTPSFGWAGEERDSLFKRGPCECIFALALIHHLAITNNLPFDHIARFFSLMGRWLIIEFVAKDDSQVKKMLTLREDIFSKYTKEGFEKSFLAYFKIVRSDKIKDTERYLYLMRIK